MTRAQENPILNSPYEEPIRHYATDVQGNLNHRDIRDGRRLFAPDVPQVPIGQQKQGGFFDVNDLKAEYGENLVNRLRDAVREWRAAGYRGVTSRVTRDLLQHWFLDAERPAHQRLFFAQQEAVEAAIWLNEVAEKSNAGTHFLSRLKMAQATAGNQEEDRLPRVAFKMATGTGKTVVLACLILYHYLNRREYRNDKRYADYFLVVAPGITIRDRLNVLFPDTTTDNPHQASDYYRQRYLVPARYRDALGELSHRLIVTNYHEFLPRQLAGNKRTPFDGKLDEAGNKVVATEDEALVMRRVLGSCKPGKRLLVINDEAHHCYREKPGAIEDDDDLKGDDKKEAQEKTVSIRRLGSQAQTSMTMDEAIAALVDEATPPDVKRANA